MSPNTSPMKLLKGEYFQQRPFLRSAGRTLEDGGRGLVCLLQTLENPDLAVMMPLFSSPYPTTNASCQVLFPRS